METNFVALQRVKEQMMNRFMETPGQGTTTMDIASAVAYSTSDLSGDMTGQTSASPAVPRCSSGRYKRRPRLPFFITQALYQT
jgi:hypothetical protein